MVVAQSLESNERTLGKLGLLMLAENDCDVSADSGVRSELASLITTYGERMAGIAVAYEGTGLRLTMLRGVVTAVGIASRTRVVTEVFSSVANCGFTLILISLASSLPVERCKVSSTSRPAVAARRK